MKVTDLEKAKQLFEKIQKTEKLIEELKEALRINSKRNRSTQQRFSFSFTEDNKKTSLVLRLNLSEKEISDILNKHLNDKQKTLEQLKKDFEIL